MTDASHALTWTQANLGVLTSSRTAQDVATLTSAAGNLPFDDASPIDRHSFLGCTFQRRANYDQ